MGELKRAWGAGAPAFLLTTTTRTGREQARRLTGGTLPCAFFPLDFRSSVRRFLDSVRPAALLLVETELWPNLLRETASRSIPVLILNGRISDRALGRYAIVAPLMRQTLSAVSLVCAQSAGDAARFVRLGLPAARARATGNLKFALAAAPTDPASILAALGLSARDEIWIAGSTAEGEEEAVLAAWRALPAAAEQRRVLVIAPRRPERFDAVARLIAGQGVPWRRRSAAGADPQPDPPSIVLLDSIGELAPLYGTASVAFVGGTIAPIGGHNILEPASRGLAPVIGPHVQNIREVAACLLEAGAAFQARDGAGLTPLFARLAADPAARREAGARAARIVGENRHSLENTVREIEPFLVPRGGGPPLGGSAPVAQEAAGPRAAPPRGSGA